MDTTIIIPQYNTATLTADLIQSLSAHEAQPWPMIVIDDGSQRQLDLPDFRGVRERVLLIEQSHAGPTVAWNRALQEVTTPYVVLLNNDVIAQDAAVDRLVQPLRNRSAAIVGAGWRNERDWPTTSRIPRQPVLEGWCLALAVETWCELSGFDETMQLYFSDTDFQFQALARRDLSTPVLAVVDVPWQHLGHRTLHQMPEQRVQWRLDRQRFREKWA